MWLLLCLRVVLPCHCCDYASSWAPWRVHRFSSSPAIHSHSIWKYSCQTLVDTTICVSLFDVTWSTILTQRARATPSPARRHTRAIPHTFARKPALALTRGQLCGRWSIHTHTLLGAYRGCFPDEFVCGATLSCQFAGPACS